MKVSDFNSFDRRVQYLKDNVDTFGSKSLKTIWDEYFPPVAYTPPVYGGGAYQTDYGKLGRFANLNINHPDN